MDGDGNWDFSPWPLSGQTRMIAIFRLIKKEVSFSCEWEKTTDDLEKAEACNVFFFFFSPLAYPEEIIYDQMLYVILK